MTTAALMLIVSLAVTFGTCDTVRADVIPSNYDPAHYFYTQNPSSYIWQRLLPRQTYSDTMVNARMVFDREYEPGYTDYPRSTSMIVGLCDTVTIKVQFLNNGTNNYSLIGMDPFDWFMPVLHKTTMDIVHHAPALDSSSLAYAVRRCASSIAPDSLPDGIPSHSQNFILAYDVWDLPHGTWVLSLWPTASMPADINVIHDGGLIEYRPAADAADSVNAWLALSSRAANCRDTVSANNWLEKARASFPTSVPVWWSIANTHSWQGDSLLCLQAFDSATKFLQQGLDPLLPDTVSSVPFVELDYMRAAEKLLQFDRYGAERYGLWHK